MLDTKLKKSKFTWGFSFRILKTVSFIFLLINIIAFSPKLLEIKTIQFDYLLEGDMKAFKDYRENAGETFSNLMLYTMGVGDRDGLSTNDSLALRNRVQKEFITTVDGTTYYYSIYSLRAASEDSSFDTKVFNTSNRSLTLPDNMELCYYWNAAQGKLITGDGYSVAEVPYLNGSSYQPIKSNLYAYSCVLAILDQDYYQEGFLETYQREAGLYSFITYNIIISFCCTVLFALLCLFTRKSGALARNIVARKTYYIIPEIKLLLLGFGIYCIMQCFYEISIPLYNLAYNKIAIRIATCIVTSIIMAFLWNDWLINRFNIFKMCIAAILYRAIKRFLNTCKWEKKYIILVYGGIVTGTLLSLYATAYLSTYIFYWYFDLYFAIHVLILFCGIALLVTAMYHINRFRRECRSITLTVSQIRNGNTDNKLLLPDNAYLKATEEDVNELEKGIELAILTKSKADKMQVELITNVSHDLKTPLTSIINYSDLLCEEELSEKAKQYALSLQEKAYRLKAMVQDVFEISKASTGNMNIEMHKLDIKKLILQTVADIDEKIEQSSLSFRYSLPENPVYILGNGEKLYRVFQNLYINAINYSLENSRVFTSINTDDEIVYIKIRNTSRQELDFDNEEILERFVRADKSRTTEGSGLGLSIAKSFTEACHGSFSIETDADMFTVSITFPLLQEDVSEEILLNETLPEDESLNN